MAEPSPFLVIVDPQVIFAADGSDWQSPFWADAEPTILRLADAFGERVVVTRWLPTADRSTSWGDYFEAWPFADVPADDPLYDLLPGFEDLSPHPTVDEPTFGKWHDQLRGIVGDAPEVVVAGVSTDCCVISTVLPAADAGARITVVADACAASTAENGAAAMHVMGLYPPQVQITSTATVLASRATTT